MKTGASIRDNIIFKTLHEELVGPCAYGEELDVLNSPSISSDVNSPFVTKTDREEILKVYPTQRYGVGVIYPMDTNLEVQHNETPQSASQEITEQVATEYIKTESYQNSFHVNQSTSEDTDDFDISLPALEPLKYWDFFFIRSKIIK